MSIISNIKEYFSCFIVILRYRISDPIGILLKVRCKVKIWELSFKLDPWQDEKWERFGLPLVALKNERGHKQRNEVAFKS